MDKTDLGDRMKLYEQAEAGQSLMPQLPICARVDGRCFSKFTRNMQRPFDTDMHNAMVITAKHLIAEMNACVAYTQSDEINIIMYSNNYRSQLLFEGRIHKTVSILASIASLRFNQAAETYLKEHLNQDDPPMFDCRVWNVPNLEEAANLMLWREKDAARNSISMAARTMYSHKQLQGKSSKEMQEMMFQSGQNWNDYPTWAKRGTFIIRKKVTKKFTPEELAKIPERHRPDPDETRERTEYTQMEMPSFTKITNRVDVLFNGAEPIEIETP